MIILFENEQLLAINKPAGMVVNQAETQREPTVQDWFKEYLGEAAFQPKNVAKSKSDWQKLIPTDWQADYGSPEEIWQERQGLVHRLDKETSGVLLLAKNPGALVNLLAQFKQRLTEKSYLALCHGQFELSAGKINAPLGRARKDRFRFAIDPSGREAETTYSVLEKFASFRWSEFKEKNVAELSEAEQKKLKPLLKRAEQIYQAGFSLVEAQPKTGRTHQIRVHFASLHHPLVGDKVYSGGKRQSLDQIWCARHFLHAAKLEFFLPDGPDWQQRQIIEAPLTTDLSKAINMVQ